MNIKEVKRLIWWVHVDGDTIFGCDLYVEAPNIDIALSIANTKLGSLREEDSTYCITSIQITQQRTTLSLE